MKSEITDNEYQQFHRLRTLSPEEQAPAVKQMHLLLLNRYIHYLVELRRMSLEEYEAKLGRRLTPEERSIFRLRVGGG